jgi:flagellar hook-length control protein FliK
MQKTSTSTQSLDAGPAAASAVISAVVPFPVPAPLLAQPPVADYASQSVPSNSNWKQTSQAPLPVEQANTAPMPEIIRPIMTQASSLPADSAFPVSTDLAPAVSNIGTSQGKGLQGSVTSAMSASAPAPNTNVAAVPSSPDTAAVLEQIAALKATLTATPRITSGALPVVAPKSITGDLAGAAQLSPGGSTSSNTVAPKTPALEVAPENLPPSQAADVSAIPTESSGSQKDMGSQSSNPGGNKSHGEGLKDDPAAFTAEPATFAQSVEASAIPPSPDSTSAVSAVQTASASDAVAVTSQVLTHQSGTETELSGALQAWNAGDNPQARSMQMANIARNPAPTEMNIALQADSLGNVQLRARVSGDQVGAAILVDRHDVHAALASDLPALHQALTERHFRVENVSLSQGPIHSGNSGSARGDDGRQTQQRNSNSQNGPSSRWAGENSAAPFDAVPGATIPDVNVIFDSNGRLSVRA